MLGVSDRLTVLIVDDEELIRILVDTYFRSLGYRVVCAVDGEDCLEQIRLIPPDVVLLDVTLPGIDGWEVCRRIRESSSVPIIMLSARAQVSDRQQGLAAGANAYITKPFLLRELDRSIRELVRRSPAA